MNLLGIDFEDWYHPQLIQPYVKNMKKIPIMFKSMEKILELLKETETKATFFVVGELLEFNPEICEKIISNGHEIAFHTMYHTRLDMPNFRDNFVKELESFEKLSCRKPIGFRAPTFSLNDNSSWVIDELENFGYRYDSSVVPAKTTMYGIPNAKKSPYRISSNNLEEHNPSGKIIEFPLMVSKFLGKTVPVAGGFYLRTLPLKIIKNSIENYESQNIPGTFYIHSWELDPLNFPKIKMSFKDNFITYNKINKTFSKMSELLKEFRFTSFEDYLSKM
jgi:polysaccharide deacetylase family protein (PEP-CTERM system associated)